MRLYKVLWSDNRLIAAFVQARNSTHTTVIHLDSAKIPMLLIWLIPHQIRPNANLGNIIISFHRNFTILLFHSKSAHES